MKMLMSNNFSIQHDNRPRMQIEWISKESNRVRDDGFYLVSNGKPGIGPFTSEEDARAVQNGMPLQIRPGTRANTP
jgi:hypothetical protein